MAPFFGRSAKTPDGLIRLAKRYDAVIFSAFTVRTSRGKYRLHVELFDDELNPQEIAEEYNRRLEQIILRYPEQWVWIHKRWQTRSAEKRSSSREYLASLQNEILERANP